MTTLQEYVAGLDNVDHIEALLNPTQRDIAIWRMLGFDDDEIADIMHIRERTIREYMRRAKITIIERMPELAGVIAGRSRNKERR